MKQIRIAGAILVGAAALWYLRSAPRPQRAGITPPVRAARTVLYYRDPMHPAYTSDRPGKAPDCGMDLQPVYTEDSLPRSHDSVGAIVEVSPERQQMIGVRTGHVERSSTTDYVRTFGRVVLDENHTFPVTTAGSGWVTRIASSLVLGNAVRAGEPLVTVSGRDYTTAQRTYLYALRAYESRSAVAPGDSLDSPDLTVREALRTLRSMGFDEAQIRGLSATRQPLLEVTLTAPASGVIVARSVFPQQRFDQGVELFRIADVKSLWIAANLSERDEPYIRRGTTASVLLASHPGFTLQATVGPAVPRADRGSRTIELRLHVENPDLLLRPDMIVDLVFPITVPEATTVPSGAVIDTGLRQTVFVDRGSGVFEPRAVQTGWHLGDRVQILRGLDPGESIVVSGNFLLDSESRIRQADAREHD